MPALPLPEWKGGGFAGVRWQAYQVAESFCDQNESGIA